MCILKLSIRFQLFVFIVIIALCTVKGQFHDKLEGSSCEWLEANGTCVSPRRCTSFFYDRLERNLPPICSFDDNNEPLVCCTDCKLKDEATKDELDKEQYKTDRKYEKKCFEYHYVLPYECHHRPVVHYNLTRVYNGTDDCYDLKTIISAALPAGGMDALRGDFPHMALLGYGPQLQSAEWLCGGSLISERFVLTAAHCGSSTQLGAVRYVALGMLKRSDPAHYWQRYYVKRFIAHPDYHPPVKYNDIALIETETSINLTRGVRPACLTHKPEFADDDVAFATGWGALGKRKENADVMQKVILKKFTPEECAAQYPVHRHLPQGINQTTQVCYGDHKQVMDTCQGDSGGPLQKRDPDAKHCVYVIIGVTSYGRECGDVGSAGVYTRVYHYLPWIESIVWP